MVQHRKLYSIFYNNLECEKIGISESFWCTREMNNIVNQVNFN